LHYFDCSQGKKGILLASRLKACAHSAYRRRAVSKIVLRKGPGLLVTLSFCLAGADVAGYDATGAGSVAPYVSAEPTAAVDGGEPEQRAMGTPRPIMLTSLAERQGGKEVPERVTVGDALSAVKWETIGLGAYMATINTAKLVNNSSSFSFKSEGWFSKSSNTVGIDKLTHAFNTYLITEILQDRIERKIGDQPAGRIAAGAVAGSLMFLAEISDGFEETGGFSSEDIVMNLTGAGFSVLRRSVPGLRDKLDYRMMIVPNSDIYTFKGRRHFRQLRYNLSLQLAGFEGLKDTPWRFVELHAGYYATGFTAAEEARGDPVRRRFYAGVGLNVGQLLFGRAPKSRAAKIGQGALRYLQLPYVGAYGRF
jgi:hypothetical protein